LSSKQRALAESIVKLSGEQVNAIQTKLANIQVSMRSYCKSGEVDYQVLSIFYLLSQVIYLF
jgi:hypothetical protein